MDPEIIQQHQEMIKVEMENKYNVENIKISILTIEKPTFIILLCFIKNLKPNEIIIKHIISKNGKIDNLEDKVEYVIRNHLGLENHSFWQEKNVDSEDLRKSIMKVCVMHNNKKNTEVNLDKEKKQEEEKKINKQ